jgi:hypothetical protein
MVGSCEELGLGLEFVSWRLWYLLDYWIPIGKIVSGFCTRFTWLLAGCTTKQEENTFHLPPILIALWCL